jgi:hypothetical protein
VAFPLCKFDILTPDQARNVVASDGGDVIHFGPLPHNLIVSDQKHLVAFLVAQPIEMEDGTVQQLLNARRRLLVRVIGKNRRAGRSTVCRGRGGCSDAFLPVRVFLRGALDPHTCDLLATRRGLHAVKEADRLACVDVGVFGALFQAVKGIERCGAAALETVRAHGRGVAPENGTIIVMVLSAIKPFSSGMLAVSAVSSQMQWKILRVGGRAVRSLSTWVCNSLTVC